MKGYNEVVLGSKRSYIPSTISREDLVHLLTVWEKYCETFGLEGDLYYELLQRQLPSEEIEKELKRRRLLVDELIGQFRKEARG